MTDASGNLHLPAGARLTGEFYTGGKHIYNYFIQGLESLPTHLDVNARVRKFLEYYVGTPEAPAPFGGRAADLAALDAWLNDPAAPPYALLAAPAGRGKSGLLAHWVTGLALAQAEGAPRRHIVFFPISLRFNTNAENVVFVGLAARLAHVYGETLESAHDVLAYRGLFSEYLHRPPPDGAPVLVVVDGLDEAAGWEALNDLFPYSPPPHLRVLAAARLLAGDPQATGWLARLGWEAPGRALRLALQALDRAGVADVLARMGNPLRALAADYDIITKLCQLSDGDPLLVRLYVEALLPHGGHAAAFTPADLEHLEPGLEAYFARWFEEQRKLWGNAEPLRDRAVRGLLNLCAAALGPLGRADVLELAPDLFAESWDLDEAARAVNRFVIGDGETSGYAFSHPRLDDYFAGRLTGKELRAWQGRFLDYGRRALAALQSGEVPPAEASPYLIQFYAAHLDPRTDAPPDPAIRALLSEGWLRAHEAVTGTPSGFLADARRAWRRAEADGSAGLRPQVLALLCFTSVIAQAANIPGEILLPCVEAGLIPPALGLVLARQKSDLVERAILLARLSPRLPAAERPALLAEALAAAEQIGSYDQNEALKAIVDHLPPELAPEAGLAAVNWTYVVHRAEVLAAVGARLPREQAQPLFENALRLARAETDGSRVYSLLALIPYLPEEAADGLAREALAAAQALADASDQAHFLAQAAAYLPEAERPAVMEAAFEAATTIEWDNQRADMLMHLAERLPAPAREQAFASLAQEFHQEAAQPRIAIKGGEEAQQREEQSQWAGLLERYAPFLPEADVQAALKQAWTIDEVSIRVHALAAVALRLPPLERREVIAQALLSTLREDEENSRLIALNYLLDKTPDELLPNAVAAVRAVPVRDQRALMLARLAARMPPAQARPVLAEALAAARALNDETYQASALAALAQQLPLARRDRVLDQAWRVIRSIPLEGLRLRQAEQMAAQPLPAVIVDEMLAEAASARGEYERADLVSALAPQLTPRQVSAALGIARAIEYGAFRCRALLRLASFAPAPEAETLYAEAAAAARETQYGEAEGLLMVAQAVPPALRPAALAEAATAIRQSPHAHLRARLLTEASELAEGDERLRLLAGAFTAATEIRDESVRGDALAALAPHLPLEFVQAALTPDNPYEVARVVEGVALRLTPGDENWDAALAAARGLRFPELRATALAALAGALPEGERGPLVGEACANVDAVEADNRARVLKDVADRLPMPERLGVLRLAVQAAEAHQPGVIGGTHGALLAALPPVERRAYAREWLDRVPLQLATTSLRAESAQAQALRNIYDGLPDELLGEALRLAWPLAEAGDADAVIRLLGGRWAVMCQAGRLNPMEALSGTLRAYTRVPRRAALAVLAALAPAVHQAGGADGVEAVAQAILDAGLWWA